MEQSEAQADQAGKDIFTLLMVHINTGESCQHTEVTQERSLCLFCHRWPSTEIVLLSAHLKNVEFVLLFQSQIFHLFFSALQEVCLCFNE